MPFRVYHNNYARPDARALQPHPPPELGGGDEGPLSCGRVSFEMKMALVMLISTKQAETIPLLKVGAPAAVSFGGVNRNMFGTPSIEDGDACRKHLRKGLHAQVRGDSYDAQQTRSACQGAGHLPGELLPASLPCLLGVDALRHGHPGQVGSRLQGRLPALAAEPRAGQGAGQPPLLDGRGRLAQQRRRRGRRSLVATALAAQAPCWRGYRRHGSALFALACRMRPLQGRLHGRNFCRAAQGAWQCDQAVQELYY